MVHMFECWLLITIHTGKRDILSLMVNCTNKQNGCSWEGDVRVVLEHLQFCKYRSVDCPKKCQQQILQKDLNNHLEDECKNRDYECPLCGDWGIFGERTTSHLENCPNRPTNCPNERCLEQVAYHRIDHHALKDCDYTILECKYRSIGCTASLMRKDIAGHEDDDKHHLHIALSTLAELRDRSASVEVLMSSAHRQYLPKADAKKLKSDIKQGIEKIHAKCENLRQELHEFIERDKVKTMAMKDLADALEALKEGVQEDREQHLRVELDCKNLQDQVAEIRQHQDNSSHLNISPTRSRQQPIFFQVISLHVDGNVHLRRQVQALSRYLYDHIFFIIVILIVLVLLTLWIHSKF